VGYIGAQKKESRFLKYWRMENAMKKKDVVIMYLVFSICIGIPATLICNSLFYDFGYNMDASGIEWCFLFFIRYIWVMAFIVCFDYILPEFKFKIVEP
jgi:hypothetical protein